MAVALFALAASAAGAGDWSKLGYDLSNSGFNSSETLVGPANVASLGLAWTQSAGGLVYATPTVVGGSLYLGGEDKYLYSLDAATGAINWRAPVPGNGVGDSSPTVANGVIYLGSERGAQVSAFDATTGARLWTTATGAVNVYASAAVANGVVYIAGDDGKLDALDATTGALLWAAPIGGTLYGAPALEAATVYTDLGAPAQLVATDAATGGRLWSAPANGNPGVQQVTLGGGLVFAAADDGSLSAFDTAACAASAGGCAPLWRVLLSQRPVTAPAFANGTVYVGSEGQLYALDPATGAVRWAGATAGTLYSPPTIANGVVYVTTRGDGSVYAFDAGGCGQASCQPLWRAQVGTAFDDFYAAPVIANGSLYAVTLHGHVFAFRLGAAGVMPETTITAGPPTTTGSTDASFSFSSDLAGASFECSLDGSLWAACTSPQTYTGLATGTHSFQVAASDANGVRDTTPASYSWTITPPDTFPPETTITSGPPSSTSETTASFTFTANEPASFACSLDGAAWTSCSSPQIYGGLATGGHSFQVRATDAAGNTDATPAGQTWTITPPAPPNDMFAAAQPLTGASGSVGGSTIGATREPGEPTIAGNPGGHSIWYRWTAPYSGAFTFTTAGSSFDTLLGVYRGTSLGALTLIGANNNAAAGTLTSRVRFKARAGVSYAIAIDGSNGAAGATSLNW